MIKEIDGIKFELKEDHDFSFLKAYGRVFKCFDKQDSGNICFGVIKASKKYFVKYAGAKTVNHHRLVADAIAVLKNVSKIYQDLRHENLVKLIDHHETAFGYMALYEWHDGDCLYLRDEKINTKLMALPLEERLKIVDQIYGFMLHTIKKAYIAVDFYDGSMMYDFDQKKLWICDIDHYVKGSFENDVGRMLGSSRFMAPEEKTKGGMIDEKTNIYLMGAVAFRLLSSSRELKDWHGPVELFHIAKKALSNDKNDRYDTMQDYYKNWRQYGNVDSSSQDSRKTLGPL